LLNPSPHVRAEDLEKDLEAIEEKMPLCQTDYSEEAGEREPGANEVWWIEESPSPSEPSPSEPSPSEPSTAPTVRYTSAQGNALGSHR
jgi:hypothetical protein